MSLSAIVFVDLNLFGYQWLAFLDRPLGPLGGLHLYVRSASAGEPHEAETYENLDLLCRHLMQGDACAVVVNTGCGGFEEHAHLLWSLVEPDTGIFFHEREGVALPMESGTPFAGARRYTTEPVAPGQEPTEPQRAWADLVERLGIVLPPFPVASLVHDFMGTLATLEVVLRSMEPPDGSRLIEELRNRLGGSQQEVGAYFRKLERSHSELVRRFKERLTVNRLDGDQLERVVTWSQSARALMKRLADLAKGDRATGKGIEHDFVSLRAALAEISGWQV